MPQRHFQDKDGYFGSPSKMENLRCFAILRVVTFSNLSALRFPLLSSPRQLLPDLFREGQGIVAQGQLNPQGIFVAQQVLAKHDEKYMPPEIKSALQQRAKT